LSQLLRKAEIFFLLFSFFCLYATFESRNKRLLLLLHVLEPDTRAITRSLSSFSFHFLSYISLLLFVSFAASPYNIFHIHTSFTSFIVCPVATVCLFLILPVLFICFVYFSHFPSFTSSLSLYNNFTCHAKSCICESN
jgi:hypothetical protein